MHTFINGALAAAALTMGCALAAGPIAVADAGYRSDQMAELAEMSKRMVTDYLTQLGISGDALPTLAFIASGQRARSQCVDVSGDETQNDWSNDYCPTDNTVYVGQNILWDSYRQYGTAGSISGLAHEYGHFVQSVMGVPNPRNANETIRHENQADCFSGSFIGFLQDRGSINAPEDLGSVERFLTATASLDAPGRDHGTAQERIDSFTLGYTGGLPPCSQYFPATPLIR
ncbi:MAG: neutral zinc metallopeptidase [Mycobacteriaceae bacterium]